MPRIDAKRIPDACLALPVLLLILAPLVKLDLPGSVLYRGKGVGRFGRPFRLIKFRTMGAGANGSGPLVTASDGPRITRLGSFLRRTKLDELSSRWNVVKGDISLVGRRPENERSALLYTSEQRSILVLRPGLTSLATLKDRHEERLLAAVPNLDEAYYRIMQDKLRLELDYLRRRTFWLDLRILFQTLLAPFD